MPLVVLFSKLVLLIHSATACSTPRASPSTSAPQQQASLTKSCFPQTLTTAMAASLSTSATMVAPTFWVLVTCLKTISLARRRSVGPLKMLPRSWSSRAPRTLCLRSVSSPLLQSKHATRFFYIFSVFTRYVALLYHQRTGPTTTQPTAPIPIWEPILASQLAFASI